jgi:hypothetical protein
VNDATEAEIVRQQAQRQAERLAAHLEKVAKRIREHGDRLGRESKRGNETVSVVADVLSEYTNIGNGAAAIVWALVRDLDASRIES